MSEVIAKRQFEVLQKDGVVNFISVTIFKPYIDSTLDSKKDATWFCEFEINEFGNAKTRVISGEDALQALMRVIGLVDEFMKAFAVRFKGSITWLGYEYPLPIYRTFTDEEDRL